MGIGGIDLNNYFFPGSPNQINGYIYDHLFVYTKDHKYFTLNIHTAVVRVTGENVCPSGFFNGNSSHYNPLL